MMAASTVPGQLDTIIDSIGNITARLEDGDRRMNEADTLRSLMNDQLSHHSLVLTDHGLKMDEQNAKLDKLIDAMAENTATTNIVRDAITTARVGRTVLTWVASVAGSIVGLWGAYAAFFRH